MKDDIGDLLREFYRVFGRPDEGPPAEFNVNQAFKNATVDQMQFSILSDVINDRKLRRDYLICQQIIETLATRLTGEDFLKYVSTESITSREFEELSSGVLWYSLASSLDKRDGPFPIAPLDNKIALPFPMKIQMVVHGSLVLRLYIALVYIREGVLSRIVSRGARAGNECCKIINKLLNSEYIRRIRNALSHGTFSSCIAGLAFRDNNGLLVASPEFLTWLSTWLMLIQLQAVTAINKTNNIT